MRDKHDTRTQELPFFRVDLEHDARPYTWHGTAADQREAIQRAKCAYAQQPAVKLEAITVTACVQGVA